MTEEWHWWFAWYPVQDINNQWSWGSRILRRWDSDKYYMCDEHGCYPEGGWRYLS